MESNKDIKRYLMVAALMLFSLADAAWALDNKEIESVTVLADARLAAPLSELASQYSQENMVSVSAAFGKSDEQKKKIEDGESADIFITADAQLIQQLKIKGLVDIYSIGRIASKKDIHYTAAVVASENMTPARCFLLFLKSPKGEATFRNNDLTVPKAVPMMPSPNLTGSTCGHL